MDIIQIDTAPVAGTNEVQQIAKTGTPTSGRFRMAMRGEQSDWIQWNAAAAAVDTALEALTGIPAGGLTTGGGPLPDTPVTLTAAGGLVGINLPQFTISASEVVGGGFAVTTTTPGVGATLRGHPKGTVVSARDTGELYVNKGTSTVPAWKLVTTAA